MSDGPAIRAAGPGAGARLAALHAAAFDAEPWDAASFESLLASPGVMALVAAGAAGDPVQAAGFILVRRAVDEAEILTLAVVPSRRREGIGARLVAAAVTSLAAQGAKALFLEVAQDNRAARALYRGAGFAEVGCRRGYYARTGMPACDALVLRLSLCG